MVTIQRDVSRSMWKEKKNERVNERCPHTTKHINLHARGRPAQTRYLYMHSTHRYFTRFQHLAHANEIAAGDLHGIVCVRAERPTATTTTTATHHK